MARSISKSRHRRAVRTTFAKPEQLIVVGVSEGFQVGAKLASIEPRISRVGLFVGNGLNQFYDFVIEERMKMERGEQSPSATQSQIDRFSVPFAISKLPQIQPINSGWDIPICDGPASQTIHLSTHSCRSKHQSLSRVVPKTETRRL